jgi:hypothetical protein
MSEAFIWRDRKGIEHRLDSPDLIEAEYDAIVAELDVLEPGLTAADDRVFLDAFAIARPMRLRLKHLAAELKRWDQHAKVRIMAESDAAVVAIGKAVETATGFATLHQTYDAMEAAHRANDMATRSGAPSAEQHAAIAAACLRLSKPKAEPVTFDAAQAWLVNEPTTNRVPRPRSAPTLEWMDRHGHHHQLRSLRPIEREYILIASELEMLVTNLSGDEFEDRRIALVRASRSFRRLAVLQRNMTAWSADAIRLARGDAVKWLKART